jgi:hypothetical protein
MLGSPWQDLMDFRRRLKSVNMTVREAQLLRGKQYENRRKLREFSDAFQGCLFRGIPKIV